MKKIIDTYGSVSNIPLSTVIKQLDKLTDMVNAISETINNLGNLSELNTVKEEIKELEKKVIAQGDVIAKIVELIDDVKRNIVDKIQ